MAKLLSLEKDLRNLGDKTQEITVNYLYPANPQHRDVLGIGLNYAGISHARKGFRFVQTKATSMQIMGCIDGRGQVYINNRWEPLLPGYAYITPCDNLYAYQITGTTWTVVWAKYNIETSRKFAKFLPTNIVRKINIDIFTKVVEGLCCEYIVDPAGETTLHWLQLLDSYVRRYIQSDRNFLAHLQPLWCAVEKRLNEDWTVDRLADFMNTSNESLRKMCQTEVGSSPMKYITRLRMHRARMLLLTTDLNVEKISQMVGYKNAFAFSVSYKKIFGIPPTKTRIR